MLNLVAAVVLARMLRILVVTDCKDKVEDMGEPIMVDIIMVGKVLDVVMERISLGHLCQRNVAVVV